MEKALGQTIVIVNPPGASNSIGTTGALDAPHDGYTRTAGAGVTSAGHNAMELIDKNTGVKYRHVTCDGGNPTVVAAVADDPTRINDAQAGVFRRMAKDAGVAIHGLHWLLVVPAALSIVSGMGSAARAIGYWNGLVEGLGCRD